MTRQTLGHHLCAAYADVNRQPAAIDDLVADKFSNFATPGEERATWSAWERAATRF
jgi:hypothetical protein